MAREGMRYWRLRPDPRLRPWILCYWMVEPDPDVGTARPEFEPGHSQLLIPDGHSEIVFRLAGSFARWRLDAPHERAQMSASYVIGGRSQSVFTHSNGGLRLAGVKLDPRALRSLLQRPLTEFRDNTIACADLGCQALSDLEDRVANLRFADQLADVFDEFFLRKPGGDVSDEPATRHLLERLRVTRGAQSILKWAREHRVDPRTLERRFVADMGMTPKQFARIERFKNSYHRLAKPGADGRRAHLDPYYDESHFYREFRHFLGTSPMAWRNQVAEFRTTIADHLLEAEFERPGCPWSS
jgi:AraC-like DNA-binding protein